MPASPGRAWTPTTPAGRRRTPAAGGSCRCRPRRSAGRRAPRPGLRQRLQVAVAADQARRPEQAGRARRPPHRQRRAAALDRREQLDRLGRGTGAELVLETLLEALEGGDRRRAVATQVVQAHQPALAVLGQRIALDQALRVDQAARDRALVLAARRPRRPAPRCIAPASAGAPGAATRPARAARRSRGRRAAPRAGRARRARFAPGLRQVGMHRFLQLQADAAAEQPQPASRRRR
jgi:hypothetical protein